MHLLLGHDGRNFLYRCIFANGDDIAGTDFPDRDPRHFPELLFHGAGTPEHDIRVKQSQHRRNMEAFVLADQIVFRHNAEQGSVISKHGNAADPVLHEYSGKFFDRHGRFRGNN